ncbi:MAG: group II truncated hemoglobin [Thermoplasmatota archaeon]
MTGLPIAHPFGTGDASYRAAGKIEGLMKLASDFYDYMDQVPDAAVIRKMHPSDIDDTKKRLAYFLAGWLGGPRLYDQSYGPINIPDFHKHLPIREAERDAWLLCMNKAIDDQDYDESFKHYLLEQLRFPAERIRQVSESYHEKGLA